MKRKTTKTKRIYTKRAAFWAKKPAPSALEAGTVSFVVKSVRINQDASGKITLQITTT